MNSAQTMESALHVMTKPIGPICNLDCAYCYYLEKEDLYPKNERWRMPDDVLRNYVQQYIAAQPISVPEIDFAWQGGEPTLLGIEFFEKVLAYQHEFARPGQTCRNSLQTNGTLLDDSWGGFLHANQFLVGLSIDGPAELHDPWRYDKKGQPSFDKVMNGWRILKKHRVEHNILCVVNRLNGDHPEKVYQFFRRNNVKYLQFIPIVERTNMQTDEVSERTVNSEQFGKFLCGVFDEWIQRDVGKIYVQIFDQALSAWVGVEPSLCIFRKQCGRALAMEHNGDLYSCDHFVFPEYKLGNIQEQSITEMVTSSAQKTFGEEKETKLPEYCKKCEVRFACNGECPKNRFIQTPDGEAGLNYLCAGYKMFFNHIDPVMKMMSQEIAQGRAPANVMHLLKQPQSKLPSQTTPANSSEKQSSTSIRSQPQLNSHNPVSPKTKPSRNQPCPCGSGRKYKSCCMRSKR